MARILVIEDVPSVMFSLRMVLEGQGHKVVTAGDGAEGLDRLNREGFDVVVTDIWMPGKDGATVIREGRAAAPQTRFLAITGGSPNGATGVGHLREEDFGADRILFKPFERQELIGAIDALTAQP
ncbi:CheY-like chemotaxis protein [Azospirillum fermentarium]|uniref:response regulator n=1 Tax=Azospirillum fermentarium TaxID=1233114 RepID=UPI0022261217|nr:response regulator [Azospirillum fermentarium]MCW2248640.1 CheY-like chemotaxis protein [Azospirillum fermentarium]